MLRYSIRRILRNNYSVKQLIAGERLKLKNPDLLSEPKESRKQMTGDLIKSMIKM
jgi:hypothetical protein